MSGRPEALWPLFAGLETLDGVGPKSAAAYAGIKVESPRDLIFTLPTGGIDRSRKASVRDVALPGVVTVEVEVLRHVAAASRARPARVFVRDAQTEFVLIFFHARAEWLDRQLPVGARRIVSGRVELYDGVAQMAHPDRILTPEEAGTLAPYEPVYPMANGLTGKGIARAVGAALSRAPELAEWIAPSLVAKEGWPAWRAALDIAHAPGGPADLSPESPARRRLAYDELLAHQITLAISRARRRAAKGRRTEGSGALRRRVLAALPYRPTGAQSRAMDEIAADMAAPHRMNRLLQGDVGAGKTLVALMALLNAVEAGGQGVMMAPTEILARQHLAALRPLAEAASVRLDILTGRDRAAERRAKLAALAAGEIAILVGTHAVFSEDVAFADLRLAVVDEQHRFGVQQRLALGEKGRRPDVLVMTATPIPRSLSLAQYGEMEISVLDEKPPGRRPIATALVEMGRMEEVVDRLRRAVAQGRRAYWVCPLVAESEASDLTAARQRFETLRAALGEGRVGLVHGQLAPAEKDAVMEEFAAGRLQVLVATTVIEVGVDVPEATIMVIERAESFGLAQLHQLRGRVGRGAEASTCVLLYQAPMGEAARRRLTLLRETEDGFRLAEEDLAMRGAGDVLGTAQSGLPRFRIANLESQGALLAAAMDDARLLLTDDPELQKPRGTAARALLWLMEQDKALRLLKVG